MKSLRQYVKEASESKTAVAHFNISNLEGFWAVVKAAQVVSKEIGLTNEQTIPVIIGTSEGEREVIGLDQAVALVQSLRVKGQPVFLNADHTYSFEKVKEALDAGYDMAIFDGAKLSMEENIIEAKKCVEYAKDLMQKTGRDILIEGELGYIGQSSKVLDAIPDGASLSVDSLTKPEDAIRFVNETGVDLLAPAVGNFHGMLRGGVDPALNIEAVASVYNVVKIPLVLHGASGNSAEDVKKSIENGVGIVHVSTELRFAYTQALRKYLAENTDENTPYKITASAGLAMQKVAEEKIRIDLRL